MVEELKPMLENISGKKLDELCDDECLFSRKYAMNARDIVLFSSRNRRTIWCSIR